MAKHKSYDSTITGQVRNKSLGDIFLVLNEDPSVERWSQYKKDMLLKLATTVLPRVTELSGPQGGPIAMQGVEITVRK